jgi:hypothetical protein
MQLYRMYAGLGRRRQAVPLAAFPCLLVCNSGLPLGLYPPECGFLCTGWAVEIGISPHLVYIGQ